MTEDKKGDYPQYDIVQATERDGKPSYTKVGAIWKNKSKEGKEYLSIKIGNLKLVGFPNLGPKKEQGRL